MDDTRGPVTGVVVIASGVALVGLLAGLSTQPTVVTTLADSTAVQNVVPAEEAEQLDWHEQPSGVEEPRRPVSVEALLQRLRQLRRKPSTESNRDRFLAIRTLGELRSDRSRQALREIAEGGSDRFERLTAMSVIWTGDDRDYLVELASRSDDPILQAKVKALRAAEAGR